MKSVPAGSFERATTVAALWRAYDACRRGKLRQPRMAAFDLDADRHVLALARQLRGGTFQPSPGSLRVVRDPKVRVIGAPAIRDRIVHRAVLDEIGPTYERGFVPQSFARGRGLGPHRAVLLLLRAMRSSRYRLLLDVRRYFPSVHRPTLLSLLAQRLRYSDMQMRELLASLLTANGAVYGSPIARRIMGLDRDPLPPECGLGLGSYLSQWCGAFYLDALDHFVLREIRPAAYLRYMDDLALLDDDGGRLADAREAVAEWLRRERRLELDAKRRHVVATAEPCVFLGYRVSRSGIAPSRKLRRRFAHRVRIAAEKGPEALARTLAAYRGLLTFGA